MLFHAPMSKAIKKVLSLILKIISLLASTHKAQATNPCGNAECSNNLPTCKIACQLASQIRTAALHRLGKRHPSCSWLS